MHNHKHGAPNLHRPADAWRFAQDPGTVTRNARRAMTRISTCISPRSSKGAVPRQVLSDSRGVSHSSWLRNHTWSIDRTSSLARQRGDGVNYVVLFNKSTPDSQSTGAPCSSFELVHAASGASAASWI